MRYLRSPLHLLTFPAGLGILALVLYGLTAPPAPAQTYDPVDKLRQALASQSGQEDNPDALEYREKKLEEAVTSLKTPADLRKALGLTDWKDTDTTANPNVAKIDRAARTKVGQKLEKVLQAMVDKDFSSRIAVAVMLGEIGVSIRALDPADKNGIGRTYSPLLMAMMEKKYEPLVRQEAARALGKVNPDPTKAVPALKELLASPLVDDQRAAAEALGSMVNTVFQVYRPGKNVSGVEAFAKDVVGVSTEVVPAAGSRLHPKKNKDGDTQVRRFALSAIHQVAAALNTLILEPVEAGKLPQPDRDPKTWDKKEKKAVADARADLEEEAKLYQPLLEVLKAQGDAVADALTDADVEVRVLARRALEMMGSANLRILRREASVPGSGKVGDQGPLWTAVEPGLLEIAKRASNPDPDIRVRRATLDFLEALEHECAPAIKVLVAGLSDSDRFIRWAAARTLGKITPPVMTELTVPALARLLNPAEDADVREAVADTLRRYGPKAEGAQTALIAMINVGDAVAREATIRAITSIGGSKAADALPGLRLALKSENVNVRRAAAEALGSLGSRAMPAIDDLRAVLMDDDGTVRAAASEAILNILAPHQK
jgi:HEAT repeat protein